MSSFFTNRSAEAIHKISIEYLSIDLDEVTINSIVDLKHYRKSPNLGAKATDRILQLVTPKGQIYFKFGLTDNEMCAELLAYHLANSLDIKVAKTALAWYKDAIGIASWSIGEYSKPDNSKSYNVLDFLHFEGFVEMCLFDYLIMNVDRHAGNWCIQNNSVAPLFDHDYSFGGDEPPIDSDSDSFMVGLTSPFEYRLQQDKILALLYKLDADKVEKFLSLVNELSDTDMFVLSELYPKQYRAIKKLFQARIIYMSRRVGELRGR